MDDDEFVRYYQNFFFMASQQQKGKELVELHIHKDDLYRLSTIARNAVPRTSTWTFPPGLEGTEEQRDYLRSVKGLAARGSHPNKLFQKAWNNGLKKLNKIYG